MAKYRKKPVVIEAWQWDLDDPFNDMPLWFAQARQEDIVFPEDRDNGVEIYHLLRVKTLEGLMTSSLGDYIIKGVDGEIYSCRKDIFEKTYEKVED